jgi:hypothetical protein
MFKYNYLNKIRELPEFVRQTGGLVVLILIIILSFFFFKCYVWRR